MEFMETFEQLSTPLRVVSVSLVIAAVHLVASLARRFSIYVGTRGRDRRLAKVRTVINLVVGTSIFSMYFLTVGWVLSEIGISLTAYLATASVIGLAVAFGSQTIVQDVIGGLTVILSDLIDIDDMVEISGQTGIVQSVGMRFTVLRNAMGADVYIPNRSLTSVINYPKGYIRCHLDVTLDRDAAVREQMVAQLRSIVSGAADQFPGILRAPSDVEEQQSTPSGKTFIRVKFRIWPGRGAPLETALKQEILIAFRQLQSDYPDSMITVNYEVERNISHLQAGKVTAGT